MLHVAHLDRGEEQGHAEVDHLLGLGAHVHDHPGVGRDEFQKF